MAVVHFIEPYCPRWKTEYEAIKKVLEAKLEGIVPQLDIQHVGSTAIEGLFAKPILDIDIIIANNHQLDEIITRLEAIGYHSRGEQGIPGRFAFRQTSHRTPITTEERIWMSHHLYVCYADSLALKNHLLFRDILRTDEALKATYSELKISLTNDPAISRESYTARKTAFVLSVLAAAGLDATSLQVISDANM